MRKKGVNGVHEWNEKLPIIETVDFKGHRLIASEKCRH